MKQIKLRCAFIILTVFLSNAYLSAQNAKRGFKLLEKSDFPKAYELFTNVLNENKEDGASLLGKMLVQADTNSTYFDLIEAWKTAVALQPLVDKLTPEEQEYIGEYFYNTEVRHISRPVKKKIEYAIETVDNKLIKHIREENNLNLVYKVLEEFPDYKYYDNVMHIRNQLEFRKYEKQNTLEGYMEFLRKFPEAAQVDKAIRYRNKLAFEMAAQTNTVQSYKDFVRQYPEAIETNAAIKKLYAAAFQDAKSKNSVQAMDQFIQEYPEALEISEARQIQKKLLYEYARKIQTLQAYNEFIRRYPEGQFYIDIFNLKSQDNGSRFLQSHPFPTQNIQWARSFEEEENDGLNACLAVDTNNAYIVGGTVFRTDTASTDAWIIKVNADGKMLWNKYVGEGFNDELNLLQVGPQNDIIGAGYTWLGTDSSSRESWIFKLGTHGEKIWTRTLGKMHVNSMIIASTGNIYLGGYLINDSLDRLYSIVVLNPSGKRLWGRTYTGKGEITKISECPDRNMVLTGTQWRAKIDPKGYLLWESPFQESDSISGSIVLPKGEICYFGMRGNKHLIIKTTADNKTVFEKELPLPEISSEILSIIQGASNQIILLMSFESHQSLNWVNIQTGALLSSSRMPAGIQVVQIVRDLNNNLILQACNGEIVIMKNNGTSF